MAHIIILERRIEFRARLTKLLEGKGHKVTSLLRPLTALEAIRHSLDDPSERFSLILANNVREDVHDLRRLVKGAKELRPTIRAILMTQSKSYPIHHEVSIVDLSIPETSSEARVVEYIEGLLK